MPYSITLNNYYIHVNHSYTYIFYIDYILKWFYIIYCNIFHNISNNN